MVTHSKCLKGSPASTWQVLTTLLIPSLFPSTPVMKLFSQIGFLRPLTASVACKWASNETLQTLFSML